MKDFELQKKLLETQLLLKSCLESPKDMIILAIDLDYRYLYFNEAHIAVMKYAYNKNIEIGMNLLECVTEKEDKIKAKANYDKAFSGISHTTIEVYGDVNKSYYESYYNPIYNEKKEIIGTTAFARDVTDRVKAKNELIAANEKISANEATLKKLNKELDIEVQKRTLELSEKNEEYLAQNEEYKQLNEELHSAKENAEESEGKLKNTFNLSPSIIARANLETGYFIEVNQAVFRILGYTIEEFKTIPIFELIHPDDRQRTNEEVEAQLKGKEVAFFENRYLCKDGTYKWMAWHGTKADNYGIVTAIGHDINESKQVKNELIKAKEKTEESEKEFRLLAEAMPQIVWVTRSDGWNIYFNRQWVEYTGLTLEESYGHGWNKPFHPDDKQRAWDAWQNAVNNNGTYSLECQLRKKDGSYRWWLVRGVPIIKNGEIIKWFGTCTDIHDIKQTNRALSIAKEKAEEADRLKTAFLQNLSHEIRTPLNAICGFSGRLSKPTLSEEKRNSFVSIIKTSSNQLLSIVSDILTVSSLETKQERVNIDKICINNIIVNLLSIFKQQSINQNISLYAKQPLSDKLSEIYTDKTKLTQILSNLISNALKFTHEGFIEFGYKLKNDVLEFYVKDSGVGIKFEQQESIFERFRQADLSINKKYGGTGLGLSISKGFVELLGGKIWVNSEIDKGSTFYFTIPFKPVNNIAETTTANKVDNRQTILVAEDEEFNFLYIEELLIDFDYKLIHAKDGKEAIKITEENQNISLILMDIKMPIMDGHTAAKIIKEQKPDLPIIAQSAYALEHEIEKYSRIFNDYLAKPIEEEALIEKVNEYMINK